MTVDNFQLSDEGAVVVPPGTGTTTTSFQEGVSPTSAYTHNAVYIRSADAVSTRADENFNDDLNQQVIVGPTTSDILRGMFEFDVSAIPASDQIDSASLVLTTLSSPTGLGGVSTINAYQYGFDIDESVSTWNDPDGDGSNATGDTTAGGTLGTLLTSATFDTTATGVDITFSDTPAFRTAVSDALVGDGFLRMILANNDETIGTHHFARFLDETAATLGNRPELQVTHSSSSAVPEPSAAVLAVLGLLGLAWFGRRRKR